ncbi:MAG: hypothetical protein Q7S13_05310, partial [Candidatus Omnitrophota bacterium]|nr:hypothetical protein [Candidatus Omnitrophota bacterium]
MNNLKAFTSQYRHFLMMALLSGAVLVAYAPSFTSHFVQWDDDVHLLDNLDVRALDRDHLLDIFTNKVNKTYIPLTVLSFAVEYHFVGLNPFVYHFTNILLHAGVT